MAHQGATHPLMGEFQLLRTLRSGNENIYKAHFSPDGCQIVSIGVTVVSLWDTEGRAPIRTWARDENTPLVTAKFSPDGRRILAAHQTSIRILNVQTGAVECRFTYQGGFLDAEFSPNGQQIVSASGDRTIKIWDTQSGAEVRTLQGHQGPVNSAEFSPNGQQIVSASGDRTIKIWDTQSGAEVRTLQGHNGVVTHSHYSPNGQHIVSVSIDRRVKVWNVSNGQLLLTIEGGNRLFYSARFSPSGQRILTTNADRIMQIWNARTGALESVIQAPPLKNYIMYAHLSRNGMRIVGVCDDNFLCVWQFNFDASLLALILATKRKREKDSRNPMLPPELWGLIKDEFGSW